MFSENVLVLSDQAAAKLAAQRRSLLSHFVRSMLAGMFSVCVTCLICSTAAPSDGEYDDSARITRAASSALAPTPP